DYWRTMKETCDIVELVEDWGQGAFGLGVVFLRGTKSTEHGAVRAARSADGNNIATLKSDFRRSGLNSWHLVAARRSQSDSRLKPGRRGSSPLPPTSPVAWRRHHEAG